MYFSVYESSKNKNTQRGLWPAVLWREKKEKECWEGGKRSEIWDVWCSERRWGGDRLRRWMYEKRERMLLVFMDLVSFYFCGNKECLVRREKKLERVWTESWGSRELQQFLIVAEILACADLGCLVMKFKPSSLRLIIPHITSRLTFSTQRDIKYLNTHNY